MTSSDFTSSELFFYDVCLFEFHLEVFANNCVHMFNLHVLLSYLNYL